jgi:site-specific recombinase XerD
MLTVTGKNDQTRLVPVHPTTVTMLTDYAARRDRLCPDTASPAFFITRTGRRIQQRWVQETFAKLLALAEIRTPPGRRRPRIHDLRHTFAVNTLIGWYRAGLNVQAHLPVLSTFLGHSSPEATYWYLQAVPELLSLAAQRLEPRLSHAHPIPREKAGQAAMTTLAPILEAFFTDRLMTQRAAAPHTIASYRDTFKLLLGYIHAQTGKLASQLDLTDLDAATIGGFLTYLESDRGNSARDPQ